MNFVEKINETDVTIIGCSGCTDELFDHSAIMQTEYKDLQMHKKHASKERIKQLISAGMILEQAGLLNLSDDEKEKLLFHLYQFKKEVVL